MFCSDKSLGRPAGIFAAVGTIWEASNLGGLNVKEYLQPRNDHAKKSFRRKKREADLSNWRGRPMTRRKKQAKALRETAGVGDQASEERFIAITSGKSRGQQGLVATCKDSSNKVKNRSRGESTGLAHVPVRAKTEE